MAAQNTTDRMISNSTEILLNQTSLNTTFNSTTLMASTNTTDQMISNSTEILSNQATMNASFNFTTSPPADSRTFLEIRIAIFIWEYYLYLLFPVAVVGNGLSCLTICSIKPLTSSSLYIAVLAVADTSTLLMKVLYRELIGHEYTIIGCKFMSFFIYTTHLLAVWIVVAMTIERFLAVQFPFRANRICTKKNAILTLVIGTFLLCIYDIAHFVTATAHRDEGMVMCTTSEKYKNFVKQWKWSDLTMTYFIPGLCLAICNGLIINAMNKSHQIQKEISTNRSEQLHEKARQNRQLTIMLVTVSALFIILTLPKGMYFVLKAQISLPKDEYSKAQRILLEQMLFFLADSNHAINFFMYFIVGRKFRERLAEIFCLRKSPSRAYMNKSTIGTDMPVSTVMSNGRI